MYYRTEDGRRIPVMEMSDNDLSDCLADGFRITQYDTTPRQDEQAVRLRLEIEVIRRRLSL